MGAVCKGNISQQHILVSISYLLILFID